MDVALCTVRCCAVPTVQNLTVILKKKKLHGKNKIASYFFSPFKLEITIWEVVTYLALVFKSTGLNTFSIQKDYNPGNHPTAGAGAPWGGWTTARFPDRKPSRNGDASHVVVYGAPEVFIPPCSFLSLLPESPAGALGSQQHPAEFRRCQGKGTRRAAQAQTPTLRDLHHQHGLGQHRGLRGKTWVFFLPLNLYFFFCLARA